MAAEFTLRVLRRQSPEQTPYFEEFRLPLTPGMNVIAALNEIRRNPKSSQGDSTPVTYEASCLEEVCGACTMNINGRPRQACSSLIEHLLVETGGGPIELRPLTKFPVVRDLMVDRQPMFAALGKVKAWVPLDGTYALGHGPTYNAELQDHQYIYSRCMTCGCCMEACPQYNADSDFIGPAPLAQVARFNAHPSGKLMARERLRAVMGPGGVTDCGNAQNCIAVCPKEIPITKGIAEVCRDTTIEGIFGWLRK